jgi:hypothetical protein
VSVIASGPFTLTSPSAVGDITANAARTVTWDAAGTLGPPVNCAKVDIELLTFSADGNTYAVTNLLSPTDNDGTQSVFIPNMNNSKARFSVACSNNIFYDISDYDQNITGGDSAFPTTGNSIYIANTANFTTITAAGGTTITGGGGLTHEALLKFLLCLLILGCWLRTRKDASAFANLD